MRKILVVVDMQNDFIDGSLGTKEALAILPNVIKKVETFDGEIIFTRDTHQTDYLQTQEGKLLPVEHCVEGTTGWEIHESLLPYAKKATIINKPTFGSQKLVDYLQDLNKKEPISEITLIGLCTDICVVTNALLIKTAFTEIPIMVDANACAGVSVEKHNAALDTMRSCQIIID